MTTCKTPARKFWINTVFKNLRAEFESFKTEPQIEALKDEWQKIFGHLPVTEVIAEDTATQCIASFDRWPTTKQFSEKLNQTIKDHQRAGEIKERQSHVNSLPDGQSEVRRLVDEGAEVIKLLKKLYFANDPWVDVQMGIVKHLNGLKKAVRTSNPKFSDLDVILEVKRLVKEELAIT